MTEIAARAAASIGSLYQFFPTKEMLARAIHDDLLDEMMGMLSALTEVAGSGSPVTIAARLFSDLADFVARHPAFSVLAQRSEIDPSRKSATRSLMREQIASLLTSTNPPMNLERAGQVAVLVLELMKMVVSVGKIDGPDVQKVIFNDVCKMLVRHLELEE